MFSNHIRTTCLHTILDLKIEQDPFTTCWCIQIWMSDTLCRPRSDAAECDIWSGSTLFAKAGLPDLLLGYIGKAPCACNISGKENTCTLTNMHHTIIWANTWKKIQRDLRDQQSLGQPGHPPCLIKSSLSARRKLLLSAQRRFWSDCADAQAYMYLSIRWTHILLCLFCHALAQLLFIQTFRVLLKFFYYYALLLLLIVIIIIEKGLLI